MTAIIVRRATAADSEAEASSTRKMFIASEDRTMWVTVPYAPREITYDNRARVSNQIERPGLPPLLSPGGVPLATMSFELTFANRDPDIDVENDLNALEQLAQSSARVVVNFGQAEAGLWRITAFSYASITRHETSQAILWATATIEFTRASDAALRTGPISGGVKPHSAAVGASASYYGGVTTVVRKGDTLGKISNRYYKTPARWRLIADANKIKHPKKSTKFKVGRKLWIPKVRK